MWQWQFHHWPSKRAQEKKTRIFLSVICAINMSYHFAICLAADLLVQRVKGVVSFLGRYLCQVTPKVSCDTKKKAALIFFTSTQLSYGTLSFGHLPDNNMLMSIEIVDGIHVLLWASKLMMDRKTAISWTWNDDIVPFLFN